MRAFVADTDGAVRLALASLLALGLHAALILGVSFENDMARSSQPLRFELVLPPPMERPEAPEISGPRTADPDPREAVIKAEAVPKSAPPPRPASAPPSVTVATPPIVKPDRRRPVTTAKSPSKPTTAGTPAKPSTAAPRPARPPSAATRPASAASPPPAKPAETTQPVKKPPARRPERTEPVEKAAETRTSSRLDSSALLGQIASLEMETHRRASAGVRRKRVNPSDTQSLEGFYIAAWVRKVEQIGEMNFPEIARRLNLNTGPVLDVSIRADGSLQEVRVVRSSGYPELDQAAQRIVKLGAPYAPFPSSLRQKYDVLQIARPWRFDPGGRIR